MSRDTVILQVPVGREELDWLERAAKLLNMTVEDFVRDALGLSKPDPTTLPYGVRHLRVIPPEAEGRS